MLLGRDHERQKIGQVLAQARAGASAALALVGEPGIGKTALLGYAASQATGMLLLRARGIESEAQIPFGSLLELIRPALVLLDQIPPPQAAALESALALRPGTAQDRFAVGAATLSLLAAYAEQRPVAVLVDDAQWLDGSSAQALLFAFRRLMADPVAVLVAVRDGEPSLLDGADLPTLRLTGLTSDEAAALMPGLPAESARRLHLATAGNPLALLELAADAADVMLTPEGGPVLVPARVSGAFLHRAGQLDQAAQQALVLAAASDTGDLATLDRAAARLDIDLSALAAAENAGLLTLHAGTVEFRHPLARSAVYADAPAEQRRAAHRALAAALPDRDGDRRAWHLAAAAAGPDEAASAALAQAAARGRDRSAYVAAAAAFERAGRLAGDDERRAWLLWQAAEAAWLAGLTSRAMTLLEEARALAVQEDPRIQVEIDRLAGHIATLRGPVMRGHAILTEAASRADPELAVTMLAEAAFAGLYAGRPAETLAAAERARASLPASPSLRTRVLAAAALGTARIIGGDAAAGADALHEAVKLAEGSAEVRDDLRLLPWLAVVPLFLRDSGTGRSLLDHALQTARDHAAVGVLPFALNLIARDQATSDRWAVAEATYREAIDLARESGQQTALAFGMAGLAWLQGRRGRERDCRAGAAEALALCRELGMGLHEIWATAALGELELGLGDAAGAVAHFERQQQLLDELAITDPDVSPAAELVDAYLKLGRTADAQRVADTFTAAAEAKGQPWPVARALRCQGMLAADTSFADYFERAVSLHEQTMDVFETARTRLAYGERLRRSRNRVLAREQLRAAADTFDALDARPWAERARAELAATGETRQPRDASTIDVLTPQELQIALLLTGGKTTREAAAALFLSPKTVEYHLRHIYQRLGIHSRDELTQRLHPGQLPSAVQRRGVPRLVDRELAAVRQPDRGQQAPALVGDVPGHLDALGAQLGQGGADVVAHQVQLVAGVSIGRVHGQLGGRQGEDEPAAARVHRRQVQHVGEERPDPLGVRGEDDRVHTGDHVPSLTAGRRAHRQSDDEHVGHGAAGLRPVGPGDFVPAPGLERALRRGSGGQHGQRGPLLAAAGQDQVMQFPADALLPPGGPDQQVGQRERPARVLGGDVAGQRRGQVPPPGRGRPQRHPGRVPDEVFAMARLGQGETRLAALHPEPVTKPRGVRTAPVRRVGVHLGVQRAQLVFVPGRLGPVQQPER
jgi:DNA-binding CsgD family transcriptional regulator